MFQIFFLTLIFTILFIFFLKIKIEVVMEDEIYIEISILKYFILRRFKFNEDEVKEIEKKSQIVAKEEVENYLKHIEFTDAKLFIKNVIELLSKVKFEIINFKLNVNVGDFILNSYITTIINTIVAMLISKNIQKINTDNINYIITSNEKETKINLKCIMYGRITNIMFVSIKVIRYVYKLKKRGNEENGKRTSNRKFNGNSNVIARSDG